MSSHRPTAAHLAAKAFIERLMAETGEQPSNLARAAGLAASTLTRHTSEAGEPPTTGFTQKTIAALESRWGVPFTPLDVRKIRRPTIPVVGYIGAGEKVYPVDEGELGSGLEEIDAPPGADLNSVAVIVKGDSMFPAFWEGDVLIYSSERGFDREACMHNECVVKVKNGPTYVKRVTPGSMQGLFTLTSYNATPIIDVAIDWAAPVQFRDQRRRLRKKWPLRGKH
jgi:phage repressor protein C with HTH and peptisase S24 domain